GSTARRRAATRPAPGSAGTTSTANDRARPCRKRRRGRRLAVPRGCTELRRDGSADGAARWRHAGRALRVRTGVAAQRDGPDVLADERRPCGALAEAARPSAKRFVHQATLEGGVAHGRYS